MFAPYETRVSFPESRPTHTSASPPQIPSQLSSHTPESVGPVNEWGRGKGGSGGSVSVSLTWDSYATAVDSTSNNSICNLSISFKLKGTLHSLANVRSLLLCFCWPIGLAMGVLHQHHRRLYAASALALLFFAFAAAASATAQTSVSPIRQLGGTGSKREEREETRRGSWLEEWERVLSRRRLGGPGSSPPTCRSKCGRCSPCKAVHVPIHPGQSIPLEYYPEAWRCKCGNKYFMP